MITHFIHLQVIQHIFKERMNGVINHSTTFDDVFNAFKIAHETQLRALGISENKWETLCLKLKNTTFDAGDAFIYSQGESLDNEEDGTSDIGQLKVFTKCSMEPDDEDHIYLIDHAWTYTLDNAKNVLEENDNLVERMCSIMNIQSSDDSVLPRIEKILTEMWKYNNSYILKNQDEDVSFTRCWFIMDEFGSLVKHSEQPTFALVPFFYAEQRLTYSLLFPIKSVTEFEEVTYAYPKYTDTLPEEKKMALKYPWKTCDLTYFDFNPIEPNLDYFESGRQQEILPDNIPELPSLAEEKNIIVYTEYPDVSEHLTLPRFFINNDKKQSHILWLSKRIFDYKTVAENSHFVSQFPSEQILVNKELFAIACRRFCENSYIDNKTLESSPKWLPTTYSLMMELPQFVSYFQSREARNLDNTWICKPFNLARGLDIYVTNNLTQIIRLNEMRPMVACKYISDPVLFPRDSVGLVKIDLRFIVLLKNVKELELFVYERFWIRFANKPFSMDDFEDYEKHFTVMNYNESPLKQMYCHEFIEEFEDFYSYKWNDIQNSINKMIKEVFQAASMKEPPAGIGSYPGSRAMYGLDVMLEWDRSHEEPQINPVILEVNWMPDCKRACQYYPEFYNDVFSVLFLDDTKEKHVVKL